MQKSISGKFREIHKGNSATCHSEFPLCKCSSSITQNLFNSVTSNDFQSMVTSGFTLKLCKKKKDNKNLNIPCCILYDPWF